MQTTTYGIADTLRRIKEKSLIVPRFQRPFTWREAQVKLLVDSLARSYPIGSVLLLAQNPDLSLASRSVDAVIRDGYPPDELLEATSDADRSDSYFILDGQQRLTSIARVFLNAHPKKTYYFDLKAMATDFDLDDGAPWVISRQKGANDPDRKEKNRLLRTDIILDHAKTDIYVSEYVEDSGDFPQFANNRTEARKASAKIKGVFENMRNYRVPVVILDRDAGVESVCRVFETINSTGTRLTTFDLAVARFYPAPDLRSMWNDTLSRYPILADFEADGERVLQVISLLRAARTRTYAEPSRSDLLALPKELISSDWELAADSLKEGYAWAAAHGARPKTLPNHGLVVALSAARAVQRTEKRSAVMNDEAVFKRWYFCKALQSGARQASNYRVGQDFQSLLRYLTDGTMPPFDRVELDDLSIVQLKPTEVKYKAAQNILAMRTRTDFISGKQISAHSDLEDHHVFPRALLRRKGRSVGVDSLGNLVPILKSSNRDLSDEAPSEYIFKIFRANSLSGTIPQLQSRFSESLLPVPCNESDCADLFALERFEEFSTNRCKLILECIREVIGDSLVAPTSDGELSDD